MRGARGPHRLRYGDLPGLGGDDGDCGALAFAQFPPDGENKLVACSAARVSRRSISPWLARAPSQVTHQPRRNFGGSAVIAAPKTSRWSAVVSD